MTAVGLVLSIFCALTYACPIFTFASMLWLTYLRLIVAPHSGHFSVCGLSDRSHPGQVTNTSTMSSGISEAVHLRITQFSGKLALQLGHCRCCGELTLWHCVHSAKRTEGMKPSSILRFDQNTGRVSAQRERYASFARTSRLGLQRSMKRGKAIRVRNKSQCLRRVNSCGSR